MGESANPLRLKRDARIEGVVITVLLVAGGGYFLDRWFRAGDRPDLEAHVKQKRADEIDIRFKQGVIMLHAKEYEHAVTAFHRVLQLAPQMPEAHTNMGFAMIGMKRYKEALDFFDGATALNPNQINAYYGMAEAFEGLGDYRGALEAMETYLHRAKPEDPFRRRAESAVWEWRERVTKAPPAAAK